MNSEVPMANTAMARRYSGRGIEWLRGEEKHEKGRLVTAVSTQGCTHTPHKGRVGTCELSGSGG